jgi:hypothetical protein
MVRKAIGQAIHAKTPEPSNIPDAYRRFAGRLTSTDYILTFNYDALLERTFDLEGIPYRLFPDRYSEVHPLSCTIDSRRDDEIVLLKLHGSVDWFCRDAFDEHIQLVRETPNMFPVGYQPNDPIFGHDAIVSPIPITDGPRPEDDPLTSLYRVAELNQVLAQPWWKCAPFILSPSTSKLFYAKHILGFWRGLQRAGGLNLSLGIVGYSLPKYDDYAMQAIYHIARNYQHYEPDFTSNGRTKTKVRIVDFLTTESAAIAFRHRYRFLDWDRTETYFSGFDNNAVDWLMR